MTKKDTALPPRVFAHGAWYRIAIARGDKREWHKLALIRDGLPAMWRAYAKFTEGDGPAAYLMPALTTKLSGCPADVPNNHAAGGQSAGATC